MRGRGGISNYPLSFVSVSAFNMAAVKTRPQWISKITNWPLFARPHFIRYLLRPIVIWYGFCCSIRISTASAICIDRIISLLSNRSRAKNGRENQEEHLGHFIQWLPSTFILSMPSMRSLSFVISWRQVYSHTFHPLLVLLLTRTTYTSNYIQDQPMHILH